MITKTQGIVVRIVPWSRTSHIVSWLSAGHGLVVTSVKGACRPKSAFLGQYDLAYTCELLFYTREHGGIHPLRECTPLQLREPLRAQWRAGSAASYLCSLAAAVTVPAQGAPEVFELLEASLDTLCHQPPRSGHLLAFEMRLLDCLGLRPDLSRCPKCNPATEPLWQRFTLASGRLLCAHASAAAQAEPAITLHRDVIATLRTFNPNANEWHLPLEHHITLGIRRFLGMFIHYHLELSPAVRRTAFGLLAD